MFIFYQNIFILLVLKKHLRTFFEYYDEIRFEFLSDDVRFEFKDLSEEKTVHSLKGFNIRCKSIFYKNMKLDSRKLKSS